MFLISPEKRFFLKNHKIRSGKMDVLFLKQCLDEIKSGSEIEDFKSMKRFDRLERLKFIKNKFERFKQRNQEIETEISFATIKLKKKIEEKFI